MSTRSTRSSSSSTSDGGKFSALVTGVIESAPFQTTAPAETVAANAIKPRPLVAGHSASADGSADTDCADYNSSETSHGNEFAVRTKHVPLSVTGR